MTEQTFPADDQYAHLRSYAAAKKQATVDRLTRAIAQLEADGRPITTFTIKEVSSLDYMTYYRNRQAFRLFQQHSTHLRKEREKAQAKQHRSKRKTTKGKEALHTVPITPRDPLLDYQRPRLVELLHEARAERDQARKQAQAERTRIEQQAQTQRAELEQRYRKLLQEHTHCGVTIAKLEAQVAEYLAFMERFRSALRQEEHGTQP
jgi:prophage tail gpP-like protein